MGEKLITLGFHDFIFDCQRISSGRIFRAKDSMLMEEEVKKLDEKTLYFAEERRSPHPRADLWFFADGQLTLLEVGGTSNGQSATNKVNMLSKILNGEKENLRDISVRAVVLLPNVDENELEIKPNEEETQAITGEDARELLGGLAQLLDWLPLE